MAEIMPVLAGHVAPGRHGATGNGPGVSLREVTGRDLVQVGVWRETLGAVAAKLERELGTAMPSNTRQASGSEQISAFMVAPDKFWITGPLALGLHDKLGAVIPAAEGVVTELGHSRTVLRVSGPRSRDLIARHVAVDLHPGVFPPGSFASSGIHGVGVMLHYARDFAGGAVFDIYMPRTFALSLFEGIAETAEPFGYTLEA